MLLSMSDIRPAVRGAIENAIAIAVTPATLITALVVCLLALGALLLSHRRLVAAAMRAAALLAILIALTIGVLTHGHVTGLDTAVTNWFVAHRSVALDMVAMGITDVGSPAATAAAGVICGVLLWWRMRSVIPACVVIGTVAAAALASTALKAIVGRPRPPLELQLIVETDHSFPSGHVTGTAALLGILAVCVGVGRSRTVQGWLAVFVTTGVAVVALTRLYLGVHWLSDVIAGAVLAGVFVTLGAAVLGTLERRPRGRGGILPAEPSCPATDDGGAQRGNLDSGNRAR